MRFVKLLYKNNIKRLALAIVYVSVNPIISVPDIMPVIFILVNNQCQLSFRFFFAIPSPSWLVPTSSTFFSCLVKVNEHLTLDHPNFLIDSLASPIFSSLTNLIWGGSFSQSVVSFFQTAISFLKSQSGASPLINSSIT